ncbi:HAD family hydrolase [Bacillus salinus]|uniref:HAD family hydrolase n=1 Tax=Bacillus sp. HMF5848 TaxID=2495421 RepID=UPI00163AEC10|nr:HAD family hydrolase [Bacillus sp. HMF5848]
MEITSVFFDLDDTLHDHQKPFVEAFEHCFPKEAKIIPHDAAYKKLRKYSDILWEDVVADKMTIVEMRIDRIKRVHADFGSTISDEEALYFQERYEEELDNIRLFPEVKRVLSTLLEHDYEVGIITNGPAEHQAKKIKRLGLDEFIPADRIIISGQMGVAKPDQRIYDEAINRVKQSPNTCLYIGDSWINDVAGAIDAGWQAVWFNIRKRKPDTNHKPVLETKQLTDILRLLNIPIQKAI